MTLPKPQQQRADLEQRVQAGDTTGAQARNARAATEKRQVDLDRELGKLREQGVLGVDKAWQARFKAITDERAANAAAAAEHEQMIEAAARVKRDAQTQLDYLLIDELATFCRDAAALSEAAKGQFSALVPAIAEAISTSQKAQREWAYLAPALRTVLRERDEAAGIYRDASYYSQMSKFPPFPIKVGDVNWTATPPGVALLPKPAPKAKRKVTA